MRHKKRLAPTTAALFAIVGLLVATPAQSQGVPIIKETVPTLPGYNVYRPKDLTALGAPAPVIVWANGGCVRSDFTWTTLFERWAAEGFVVITITSLPGEKVDAASPRSTVDHQAAAIDWAVKENEAPGSPFVGRLDVNRIAVAGNSCGGITSLTLASRDARPKAVFVLSGSSAGPDATREAAGAVMNKVSVPVMIVVGGKEDIARAPANMDYELLPKGIAGMVVERNSADHVTVSTNPAILADVADMGATWFKATLYQNKDALRLLVTSICSRCTPNTWTAKSKDLGAGK